MSQSVFGHRQGSGNGSGSALARRAIHAARIVTELDGGHAVDDRQRAVLEGFPGWGPASKLFDSQPAGAWAELADELDEAIGESMARAARVVDTSFFTPAELVSHIWGVLRAAGFTGGSVLDLGCGSGNFLTHAPTDLPIAMTGVEADPTSAQIARALHPAVNIITGDLQAVSLPHKRFDACVGNVPFSAARVHDGAIGFYGPLHEYFVTRAVTAVRPGGYVVVVTSRHELDATHGLSESIASHADLIAAVRLPSGYFRECGTDVVADVLVLRVRDGDDDVHGWHPAGGDERMLLAGEVGDRYVSEWVSSFWGQHPELVAGTMRLTGFDRLPLAVDTDTPSAAVAVAFAAVEPLLVPYADDDAGVIDLSDIRLTDEQGRKQGSFHIVDGQVMRVVDGELAVVSRPSAELRALIGLRDAAIALVDAESNWDRSDEAVEPLRIACRQAYEEYAARYGALNRGTVTEGKPDPDTGMPRMGWRTPPMGGFRRDPDAQIVFALELFNQDTGEASPAPILTRRVNKRPEPVTSAATAGEALAICLGEGRGLDLDRIGGLLGLTDREEVFGELGDLVYRDPLDGRALIARDYLCGNVREKLREALSAAAMDPRYERNVAALQAVQPSWLGRDEIRIELGSPWVTAGDIAVFCEEVFGSKARVEHVAPLAAWEITNRGQLSPEARIAYCSPRMDAFDLLQTGLNGAAPVVWDEFYDEVAHKHRKVRNADATEAAEQKLLAIQERFSLWVWENADRERRIVEQYNATMNAHVLRRHDGSHLTFPGLADGIDLWPWQRDFVDRAVSTPSVYCAHEVGLGKTLTAITLAMTLRQFGLANRPALVVPLHLIEQATRQCYQAWPAGRFLIVTREDLHGDARRQFVARCATGDWDLVIMTHETFSSIPVPTKVERAWLEDQLGELENFARTEGYTGKRIAAAVRSLEGRIKRLRSSVNDPNAITFNSLGLDYLIVDEADRFRRLPVTTRADGFSLGSSKRALDLYLKLSLLRRASPDRPHACLMTGTPFTNTLAEAFVWQTMLAPEQLARTGLSHFDAWAAQFVRYKVLIETTPDGSGFRSRRRPGTIQNVPELRTMLSDFMSMVRAESVGLPRPEVRNHTHLTDRTLRQEAFMETLVERVDAMQKRLPSANADNMLLICGDGRKVALDPNLVGICETAPKLEGVASLVADIYHNTKGLMYEGSTNPGAFQLVMCDLGTPKKGDAQSYGRIRDGLIARGVPAEKIRFVHEATTPKAREALFAACRDGRVAVLIGSTAKVGIGTNVQHRLHSLHHADPTWTAAAWEQRNGRIQRNGNQHDVVDIHSHVARATFDAFMFGTVERKSQGFSQLYRHDGEAREIEDIGDDTLTFGELKAAAAGNDLLLRQHELQTRVRTLRLAYVTVQQNVRTLLNSAAYSDKTAEAAAKRLQQLTAFVEHCADKMADVDLTRVAEDACASRDPNRYYPRYRAEWSGYRVSIRTVDTEPGQRLELSFDHRTLWAEPIPGKVRRRGPEAIKAWAEAMVAAWAAGADREIAQTRGKLAESQRRAQEARDTAAATDVSEPAELIAARAELAEVNKAIDEALNEEEPPAAA
ncbi:methyltransferase domain-containing protein [Mycolicibacterium fortuitum]|uniref:methyltransferase domain-containing protein n=1 Tax=Mycolicibacterium fortuitum TaxID=1766 RepID=UPI001CDB6637|nr:methyltransferase domain-containing protein [Mycolicibacterium fortuitum]UBV22309.1 methyltransferase domain-containing protein [Mycolicibacterium fortuitum]